MSVFSETMSLHENIFRQTNFSFFCLPQIWCVFWDSNAFIVNKKKQIRTVTPLRTENYRNKFCVL